MITSDDSESLYVSDTLTEEQKM